MTIAALLIALLVIVIIFYVVWKFVPPSPAPINMIMRWAVFVILIIILFAILFQLIGLVDVGGVLNKRVS